MTKEQILADLDYASSLAKDGANTPLLGGSIGVMWGCLLIPTLILHGLTLIDFIPMATQNVGFFWMVYGILGTILSIVLGKRIDQKPGAQSTLNKVGTALGISLGILVFTFAITTVITVIKGGLPFYMYNLILVFAFGLMTLNHAVLAYLSGLNYLRLAAIFAGSFMVISLLMVTQHHVYFVAAAGVFLAQIIPSVIELKNERGNG